MRMGHGRISPSIEVSDGLAIAMKVGQTQKVPTCHSASFSLTQRGLVARWPLINV
jgi:hypothetical protein